MMRRTVEGLMPRAFHSPWSRSRWETTRLLVEDRTVMAEMTTAAMMIPVSASTPSSAALPRALAAALIPWTTLN